MSINKKITFHFVLHHFRWSNLGRLCFSNMNCCYWELHWQKLSEKHRNKMSIFSNFSIRSLPVHWIFLTLKFKQITKMHRDAHGYKVQYNGFRFWHIITNERASINNAIKLNYPLHSTLRFLILSTIFVF